MDTDRPEEKEESKKVQNLMARAIVLGGLFIGSLFVAPAHHHQGIGTKLVLWARELKKEPLEVDVFLGNEGARKFYNTLDFLTEFESIFDGKSSNYTQFHMIQYQ